MRARYRQAKVARDEAVLQYQAAVLRALQEVADGLLSRQKLAEEHVQLRVAGARRRARWRRAVVAPMTLETRDASFPLLVRVAFCRRQIPTELLGGPSRAIAGRVALDAPSFSERAGVHDVEAELINDG